MSITHETYIPATTAEGYPVPAGYGSPTTRFVYGWQPETLTAGGKDVESDASHGMRVTDRIELLVPDVSPYSGLDRITVGLLTYRVDQIMDYNTGPFDFQPGGVVVVERISG